MNKDNLEKPSFLKRSIAYLIDMVIVTLLATLISMVLINNKDYQQKTSQLLGLTTKLTDGDITSEEYNKEANELNYYITRESVGVTIINISIAVVYYVILCWYCHGITLGKYIMKLRIVSSNDNDLNLGNYLLRGLLINLILSNIVSVVFVLTMNKDTFISFYPKVSNVLTIFLLATIIVIMYRNDGRGLHDIISNTKVISTKESKVKQDENSEVKEAKVIEEKKTTKKKTKKEVK